MGHRILSRRTIKWRTALTPLILVLLLTPVVYGDVNHSPFQITMEGWAPYYRPFEATVQSQIPIQWNNPTASPHTIRHDACIKNGPCLFDSGAVLPNGRYTIQGLPPGRYPYHCELHPIMRGELIVGTKYSAELVR